MSTQTVGEVATAQGPRLRLVPAGPERFTVIHTPTGKTIGHVGRLHGGWAFVCHSGECSEYAHLAYPSAVVAAMALNAHDLNHQLERIAGRLR